MLAPDKLAALRAALETEPAVRLAYLFGSGVRGDDGPGSDIDVALWLADEVDLFALGALGERLSAAVAGNVDVTDLRSAPPLLCRQVVAEGEPLVVRDPLFRFDFQIETVRRYEDTKPLRALQQQLLRELVAHGRAA
ncbi:MAG: nucleotidyltransferase domain-containing protein [Deltaproteobacteria bacterium]|nr:nucleotidyltransferase domain-containing protein [Deltaproteobacteria bacterium]